jgi:hypothetical protein
MLRFLFGSPRLAGQLMEEWSLANNYPIPLFVAGQQRERDGVAAIETDRCCVVPFVNRHSRRQLIDVAADAFPYLRVRSCARLASRADSPRVERMKPCFSGAQTRDHRQ